MIRTFCSAGGRAALFATTLAVGLSVATSGADAGFLDQLFGGGSAPSQPSFGYEPPQQPAPEFNYAPIKPRPRAKRVAVQEEESPRQKTTDLWHDKTLRPGDAIMMKDGMHVFRGPSASLHMAKEFVPVDHARVAPKQRAALVAMDTSHTVPKESKTAALATGRSTTVSTPVTEGIKITDARGASIRYVGP